MILVAVATLLEYYSTTIVCCPLESQQAHPYMHSSTYGAPLDCISTPTFAAHTGIEASRSLLFVDNSNGRLLG
jgi:hypothetical protein